MGIARTPLVPYVVSMAPAAVSRAMRRVRAEVLGNVGPSVQAPCTRPWSSTQAATLVVTVDVENVAAVAVLDVAASTTATVASETTMARVRRMERTVRNPRAWANPQSVPSAQVPSLGRSGPAIDGWAVDEGRA
jgi:hypothetical protein